jgi:hypothetical protein
VPRDFISAGGENDGRARRRRRRSACIGHKEGLSFMGQPMGPTVNRCQREDPLPAVLRSPLPDLLLLLT